MPRLGFWARTALDVPVGPSQLRMFWDSLEQLEWLLWDLRSNRGDKRNLLECRTLGCCIPELLRWQKPEPPLPLQTHQSWALLFSTCALTQSVHNTEPFSSNGNLLLPKLELQQAPAFHPEGQILPGQNHPRSSSASPRKWNPSRDGQLLPENSHHQALENGMGKAAVIEFP